MKPATNSTTSSLPRCSSAWLIVIGLPKSSGSPSSHPASVCTDDWRTWCLYRYRAHSEEKDLAVAGVMRQINYSRVSISRSTSPAGQYSTQLRAILWRVLTPRRTKDAFAMIRVVCGPYVTGTALLPQELRARRSMRVQVAVLSARLHNSVSYIVGDR
ncbi:hypothetical protein B0T22DRAFT_436520 [Podospora appendiculata]|uniref:Uncharacterized protein n=1 Tax=Podospora appendiculata TaxID=314037 RepID=A0AAE1CGC7_9PEZI|nr:hypothetical protein B0T22DRAFT_436520 [Podospora appendiculata]